MLRLWIILTALSACCLIAASCADPGSAITTIETAKAATLAAGAATQAATEAATQITAALQAGQPITVNDGKGTTVVETKDFWVVFRGKQRIVIMKGPADRYANPDVP